MSRHPRAGGDPERPGHALELILDPRLRGDDGWKIENKIKDSRFCQPDQSRGILIFRRQ